MIFFDIRRPLQLWFRVSLYIESQKNRVIIVTIGLQKFLCLSNYHTAWEGLHKLRKVMAGPGRGAAGMATINGCN